MTTVLCWCITPRGCGERTRFAGPVLSSQDIQAQRHVADIPQRSFGWLGPIAVLTALASALTTFLVLSGVTPIPAAHDVVVWVFILNGALIVLLVGIVAWQTKKLVRERRAGAPRRACT